MLNPAFCLFLLTAQCQSAERYSRALGAGRPSSSCSIIRRSVERCQVHRDLHALEAPIADRLVDPNATARSASATKFLADIKGPEFRPSAMNIRAVKVNVYRDTAVVTGAYHPKGTYGGKQYDHTGRFTDTWIFEWTLALRASHSSLLKNSAVPPSTPHLELTT